MKMKVGGSLGLGRHLPQGREHQKSKSNRIVNQHDFKREGAEITLAGATLCSSDEWHHRLQVPNANRWEHCLSGIIFRVSL